MPNYVSMAARRCRSKFLIWIGPRITSARNPVIIQRILDPLEGDDPRWFAEDVEIAR
jgi:hypothetical protein